MAINLALCLLLSGPLRLGGIALAGSVSAYCGFFLLLLLLRNRTGPIMDRNVLLSLLKSLAAALCMAGVLWYMQSRFQELMLERRMVNVLLTLGLILLGLAVYLSVNLVLKNRDVLELKRIVQNSVRSK
jgi:peptidoglycan biosynthesis protein MviN/MurJ (putative lipid II flippase)